MSPQKSLADLVAVMAALRTPLTGCPWDLEQSFASIAPYTLEEAYEVVDAIERGHLGDLKEELGDLLLQVVYHARLAEEQSAFALADVVHGITTKMIRRHPHVFGDTAARSVGAAQGVWEAIKAEEKQVRLRADTVPQVPSVLDDVPASMPGLTRALKLQAKAAKVGFDWPSLAPVFDKVREELAELEQAVALAPPIGADGTHGGSDIEDEFGDLLFVMANIARHLKLDPEAAIRRTNRKFTRRFRAIEHALAKDGRTPADSSLAEMDDLWNQAKAVEKQSP
jgi:nucleoside triphosphate diphosphatase